VDSLAHRWSWHWRTVLSAAGVGTHTTGTAFSVQAKASTLVTTGLYSRIRNPIYVFGGLAIAGFFLWVNMPWLLLLFVIVIPMQVWRSRIESRVLEEKFGAEYVEYKKKTWF